MCRWRGRKRQPGRGTFPNRDTSPHIVPVSMGQSMGASRLLFILLQTSMESWGWQSGTYRILPWLSCRVVWVPLRHFAAAAAATASLVALSPSLSPSKVFPYSGTLFDAGEPPQRLVPLVFGAFFTLLFGPGAVFPYPKKWYLPDVTSTQFPESDLLWACDMGSDGTRNGPALLGSKRRKGRKKEEEAREHTRFVSNLFKSRCIVATPCPRVLGRQSLVLQSLSSIHLSRSLS